MSPSGMKDVDGLLHLPINLWLQLGQRWGAEKSNNTTGIVESTVLILSVWL